MSRLMKAPCEQASERQKDVFLSDYTNENTKTSFNAVISSPCRNNTKEIASKQFSCEKAIDVSKGFDQTVITGRDDSFLCLSHEWLTQLSPHIKISSASKFSNILERYLLPRFMSIRTSDISRNDVADLTAWLLTSAGIKGTGLSPKTVSDILSVLRSTLNYAANIKGVTVADIRDITVKQTNLPLRVLSGGEQNRLNKYLLGDMSLVNSGILLSLYTGIRIGEVCALKWGDIDSAEHTIYICKTMQRVQVPNAKERKTAVIISSPKSACSVRWIPVPKGIFSLLEKSRQEDDCFFLTGSKKYIEPRTMENRFNKVMKMCNISDATFHTLRHTFATRCVELGFDIKTLSEILGHANVNITMNRYVHPSIDHKKKSMELLSELLEQ